MTTRTINCVLTINVLTVRWVALRTWNLGQGSTSGSNVFCTSGTLVALLRLRSPKQTELASECDGSTEHTSAENEQHSYFYNYNKIPLLVGLKIVVTGMLCVVGYFDSVRCRIPGSVRALFCRPLVSGTGQRRRLRADSGSFRTIFRLCCASNFGRFWQILRHAACWSWSYETCVSPRKLANMFGYRLAF